MIRERRRRGDSVALVESEREVKASVYANMLAGGFLGA